MPLRPRYAPMRPLCRTNPLRRTNPLSRMHPLCPTPPPCPYATYGTNVWCAATRRGMAGAHRNDLRRYIYALYRRCACWGECLKQNKTVIGPKISNRLVPRSVTGVRIIDRKASGSMPSVCEAERVASVSNPKP
eukprot:2196007-Rhodomonas_salina.3